MRENRKKAEITLYGLLYAEWLKAGSSLIKVQNPLKLSGQGYWKLNDHNQILSGILATQPGSV